MEYKFGFINFLVIVVNPRIMKWEVVAWEEKRTYYLKSFDEYADAHAYAMDFKQYCNPNVEIIEAPAPTGGNLPERWDNTCRARSCQWCINDACVLQPRDTNLPLPKEDLSESEWTEENSMIPRLCLSFTAVDSA